MQVKNIKDDPNGSEYQYWKDFFERLLPDLGISKYQSDFIVELVDTYTDPISFVCFDDVEPVLSELQRKGFILGIISNTFPSVDKILDHLNLKRYFKYLFFAFELPYAKPQSEIYHFAAQKVNIPIENILFVDDRWSFVKGAQKANMNALLLERERDVYREIHTASLMSRIKNLKELLTIVERPRNKLEHRSDPPR